MKQRIQKVLANAGVASRRAIEEMVLEGRVSVNGRTPTTLPILIDPEIDKVEVDGQGVRLRTGLADRRFYILLNKPRDVVTTNVAQGTQVRAIDLLPREFHARVYPVGQLEAESKGLVLLTNDGDLTNRLTHPRYGVAKVYRAIVDGVVSSSAIAQLQSGVFLVDPKTLRATRATASGVKIVKRLKDRTVLEIILTDGRNRQVRRMLAKLGHKVRDLTRTAMGPLTIDDVPAGKFRELTPREVKDLQRLARHSPKPQAQTHADAPVTTRPTRTPPRAAMHKRTGRKPPRARSRRRG